MPPYIPVGYLYIPMGVQGEWNEWNTRRRCHPMGYSKLTYEDYIDNPDVWGVTLQIGRASCRERV